MKLDPFYLIVDSANWVEGSELVVSGSAFSFQEERHSTPKKLAAGKSGGYGLAVRQSLFLII
ncbi:hypothetical protein REMIM1_PE00388 (plasmid) [Rhizobium etli bv. mimosae str. Mim1]|nr:hypothetical protein REMIM1_PE00388 [Rhizobium etli bv. mimosae str. Mim1]